jgi:hypothetical protein
MFHLFHYCPKCLNCPTYPMIRWIRLNQSYPKFRYCLTNRLFLMYRLFQMCHQYLMFHLNQSYPKYHYYPKFH